MEETKTKIDMEEITRAAKATYQRLPAEEKREIEKMFRAMDQDGDERISVEEFKTYFVRKGDHAKIDSNLFNLIDRNGDGNLGLDEVLTLFYVSESGRPVCDGCGNFIQALFFTCTDCHYSKPTENGYNICLTCYETGAFKHDHEEFIDNYTLFADMKKKNGPESVRIQTNSTDMSSDRSLSSKGINQPKGRKRDIFKKGFLVILQLVSGAAAVVGLTTIDDGDGTQQEEAQNSAPDGG